MFDEQQWIEYAEERAIVRGTAGRVRWIVTPTYMPMGLNGYLLLPEGHPWLAEETEADHPTEVSFREGNVIGVSGASGLVQWDVDDLRAAVDPWPGEWDTFLESMKRVEEAVGPLTFSKAFGGYMYTVEGWSTTIHRWAEDADRVYPGSAVEAEGRS
jgi:hypothetical protein